MQAREAAAHDREPCARDLRRGFEVEPAQVFTDLHVILGREVKGPKRSEFAHFDIGGFVAPFGHRGMQRVGQA